MGGLQISFDQPWYLLLLLLLPLLWHFSYRSLAGLGRVRRVAALVLRSLVLTLCVLALAEVQLLWVSERVAVVYVLDQSLSIPEAQRDAMLEYVAQEVRTHRNKQREDLAGVVVFGRDAAIEVPPFDDDIHNVGRIESLFQVPRDATNLDAALKLAQASFPEHAARRIVVVTDGNENIGNARVAARQLAENGIGIDVIPVRTEAGREVTVEKVVLPPDVRQGQPYDVRVVVQNYASNVSDEAANESPASDDADPSAAVTGTLKVSRWVGRSEQLISEQPVTLKPGKNIYTFQQQVDLPTVYTYKAVFFPSNNRDDALPQNNEATAFTHIRGKGRVLLIEDFENTGDFDFLVEKLRELNIEVDVQPSNNLFNSLAELQAYDSVILANVPRVSGEKDETVHAFSDEQIAMLARNTEQLGCGLVMLGGENSFGVGGWANTDVEKALPVDCQIKNAKVQGVGALVLMMHASEMAQGNYWQKIVARKAVDVLGPRDFAGCIRWDDQGGRESWLWNASQGGLVRIGPNKQRMLSAIDRMTPGDMPDFDASMRMALNGFQRAKEAAVKHMIVISDGDPSPPSSMLISSFKKAEIKISTVGIGTHGVPNQQLLRDVANRTGGKYYNVTDPKTLPAIFMKEARKAARPLVKNLEDVPPQITYRHELLQGIEGPLPPLKGFVMTTKKDSPLVEVAMRSPDPGDEENSTILATWTYGLGRSVALTTDGGARWASAWKGWNDYTKLFSQMIRWSMRPSGDTGKFGVATEQRDGKVRVVVTALNQNDEFLNFLSMSAAGLDPDLKSVDLKVQQVAPGRYVSEFEASKAGSYFVTINPGPGFAPLLTGVNVSYSSEYLDRQANAALLTTLSSYTPKGGNSGRLIEGALRRDALQDLLKVDTFRADLPKAMSRENVWPWVLVMAAGLFFGDVLVRRVMFTGEWFEPVVTRVKQFLRRRDEAAPVAARLERLRNRKASLAGELDERRAATRFEPQSSAATAAGESTESGPLVDDAGRSNVSAPSRPAPTKSSTGLGEVSAEKESYTSRLLKAKKEARRDQP
ncbi:MAG: VWA domain-containing protein [Planctomycetota bacterium]